MLVVLRTRDYNKILIENSLIKSRLSVIIFGVKLDYQLTFDQHVKSLCNI